MENPLAQSRLLIILTIVYNIVEGIIALYFGFQTNSTSLLGFGFDSTIEITASIIALWGISGGKKNEKISERLIAYSFLLLIVFIATKSMFDLVNLNKPEASIYGILIAILSILVEGPLAYKKLKIGKELQNNVLIAEAKETLFCLNLSILVILGVGVNYLSGIWYFDPIAALLMIPWLFYEFKNHIN
jgi:divalent metal cation (Fe/Co/Zn/Cd) transporter